MSLPIVRRPVDVPRQTNNERPNIDLVWCITTSSYSIVAIVAWIAQFIVMDSQTFAIVTNLAFLVDIFAILYLSYRYETRIHPLIFGVAPIVTILGTSSFAFHDGRIMNAPKHTLDISMAWFMYVYLACISMFTLVKQLIPNRLRESVVVIMIVFNVATLGIVINYDAIYRHQFELFFACGAVMYVATLCNRFIVHKKDRDTTLAVAHATWDVATLVALQAVTTTFQGQMWHKSLSDDNYNIEHGYWHLGNAMIILVVVLYNIQSFQETRVRPLSVYGVVVQIALWMFLSIMLVLCLSVPHDNPAYYPVAFLSQCFLFVVSSLCTLRGSLVR